MSMISIYILTAILVLMGAALTFLSYQITKLKDNIESFNTVHISQAQIYKESLDDIFKNYRDLYDLFTKMHDMQDLMYQQYKDILELKKKESEVTQMMVEQYKKMVDHHKMLLECCKDIDEQYSVTCDQFEQIGKGIADIYAKVTEISEQWTTVDLSGFDEDDVYWDPMYSFSLKEHPNEENATLKEEDDE